MVAIKREHFFVDGRWIEPLRQSAPITVYSSITEGPLEQVPAASPEDVDAAVRAAHRAFPGWAALDMAERCGFLRRMADGLRARADVIAPLISQEVGMPIEGATGYQTLKAADFLTSFADLAETYELESQLDQSLVVKEPVGVVGAISPSNFPLLLSLNKVGAALSVGCTMVLKAPETAPGSLFHLAEIAHEVGLPPGVLNVITGYGTEAGEPLATHPLVDLISFTGSTGVGRRLLELGARTIKRAHLELGGKSAALVLDDAELEPALRAIAGQALINAGQICFAWSRIVVPEDRLGESEEILAAIVGDHRVGDPLDPETTLGPIVTDAARNRVREHIGRAVDEGARIVSGGIDPPDETNRGYFVRPTVLSNVDNRMRIAQEEVFGPVACLIGHRGDADAVQTANDSIFGLHGAVFSADQERAMAAARGIRTGQVDINGFKLGMQAPFGGFKQSGLGRELGRYGIEEYLEVKAIQP